MSDIALKHVKRILSDHDYVKYSSFTDSSKDEIAILESNVILDPLSVQDSIIRNQCKLEESKVVDELPNSGIEANDLCDLLDKFEAISSSPNILTPAASPGCSRDWVDTLTLKIISESNESEMTPPTTPPIQEQTEQISNEKLKKGSCTTSSSNKKHLFEQADKTAEKRKSNVNTVCSGERCMKDINASKEKEKKDICLETAFKPCDVVLSTSQNEANQTFQKQKYSNEGKHFHCDKNNRNHDKRKSEDNDEYYCKEQKKIKLRRSSSTSRDDQACENDDVSCRELRQSKYNIERRKHGEIGGRRSHDCRNDKRRGYHIGNSHREHWRYLRNIEYERKVDFKLGRSNITDVAKEERREIFAGGLPYGTTRDDLYKRFRKFGPIEKISVHLRVGDRDNYGFVTFLHPGDARDCIERGNSDPKEPKFDLCFGGRRQFCGGSYVDFDSTTSHLEELHEAYGKACDIVMEEDDFDRLLRDCQRQLEG